MASFVGDVFCSQEALRVVADGNGGLVSWHAVGGNIELCVKSLHFGEMACATFGPKDRFCSHEQSKTSQKEWVERLSSVPWSSLGGSLNSFEVLGGEPIKTYIDVAASERFGAKEHAVCDFKYPRRARLDKKFLKDVCQKTFRAILASTRPANPICKLFVGVHDTLSYPVGMLENDSALVEFVEEFCGATFPPVPRSSVALRSFPVAVELKGEVLVRAFEDSPEAFKQVGSVLVFAEGNAGFDYRGDDDMPVRLFIEEDLLEKDTSAFVVKQSREGKRGSDELDLSTLKDRGGWEKWKEELPALEQRVVYEVEIKLPRELAGASCHRDSFPEAPPMTPFGAWLRVKEKNIDLVAKLGSGRFNVRFFPTESEKCKAAAEWYVDRALLYPEEDLADSRPWFVVVHLDERSIFEREFPKGSVGLLIASCEAKWEKVFGFSSLLGKEGLKILDVVWEEVYSSWELPRDFVPVVLDIENDDLEDSTKNWLKGDQPTSWDLISGDCIPQTECVSLLLEKITSMAATERPLFLPLRRESPSCGMTTVLMQAAVGVAKLGYSSFFVEKWDTRADAGEYVKQCLCFSERLYLFIDDSADQLFTERFLSSLKKLAFKKEVVVVFASTKNDVGLVVDPILSKNCLKLYSLKVKALWGKERIYHVVQWMLQNFQKLDVEDRHICVLGLAVTKGKFEPARKLLNQLNFDDVSLFVLAFASAFCAERKYRRVKLDIDETLMDSIFVKKRRQRMGLHTCRFLHPFLARLFMQLWCSKNSPKEAFFVWENIPAEAVKMIWKRAKVCMNRTMMRVQKEKLCCGVFHD